MTRRPIKLSILLLSLTTVYSVVPAVAQEKQESRPPVVNEARKTIEDLKAAPPTVGAPVDPKTYKLGTEDVILIKVWRDADLSGPVMVRPDGKISMPLVGELAAAGQTPEELGKAITEALSKFMTKPDVFISVQQINSKKFYLIGEVNKTGAFTLVSPTTVLEAISAAGGLREYANSKKIVVVRGDKRIKFNYKEVVAGKNLAQNIYVEAGDQIIVP